MNRARIFGIDFNSFYDRRGQSCESSNSGNDGWNIPL